jgi:hypothetical protein
VTAELLGIEQLAIRPGGALHAPILPDLRTNRESSGLLSSLLGLTSPRIR